MADHPHSSVSILHGVVSDKQGNAITWLWATGPTGVLPNSVETMALVYRITADFHDVFGHNHSRVGIAVVPWAGEKLSKVARWDREPDNGRRGIHVEDTTEEGQ